MSNRTDIVVETDNAEGQVLLSASRVYDLTEDKTQDTINSEVKNTLTQHGNTLNADEASLAIPQSGNTASQSIPVGAFIHLTGNTNGLADGYYRNKSTSAISSGTTFTSSNLEAQSGTSPAGALNTLRNDAGTGYCKTPDGTLIQWGRWSSLAFDITTAVSGTGLYRGSYQINFPKSFSGEYSISGSTQYSTGLSFPFGCPTSGMANSSATVYIYNDSSKSGNDGRINWIAIGR